MTFLNSLLNNSKEHSNPFQHWELNEPLTIDAIKEISVEVPIVVRLQGNMSEEGKLLLNDSGMNVIGEDSLQEASKRIVELVK